MIYVAAHCVTNRLKNPKEEMDSMWCDLDTFHAPSTTWEKPVENYTLKEKFWEQTELGGIRLLLLPSAYRRTSGFHTFN